MKEIHISATPPPTLQSCSEDFYVVYPNAGKGTISLSPDGVYDLSVMGITEGAAYRSQEYKTAQDNVTAAMISAYEARDQYHTALHHKMKPLCTQEEGEQALRALTPQKYQRETFSLPRPTRDEVENDLKEEEQALKFYEENDATRREKLKPTQRNVNQLLEERQYSWRVACDLFDEIEAARETRANEGFHADYKHRYERQLGFIEGRTESVDEAMNSLQGTVKTPYALRLAYDYHREQSLLNVNVTVESGFTVPTLKAVRLASGKISVKNKLVKEAAFDRTNSVVSLTYYLANALLNVSPHIQHLCLSVFDQSPQTPLLWVNFERTRFAQTQPQTVGLVSDVQSYPNVACFKMRGEALELAAMSVSTFEKRVAELKANL